MPIVQATVMAGAQPDDLACPRVVVVVRVQAAAGIACDGLTRRWPRYPPFAELSPNLALRRACFAIPLVPRFGRKVTGDTAVWLASAFALRSQLLRRALLALRPTCGNAILAVVPMPVLG
jgi:hypothetical protein